MADEALIADDTSGPGKGFTLVMQLEDPAKLPELMGKLGAARDSLDKALGTLDYVHYSRFVPLWQHGLLLIVTEFDGAASDYVMDFAAVLDDEFSLILSYMKNRPRLPVSRYPDEFWAYVERNTRPPDPLPRFRDPFSPYSDKSVLDIVGAGRRKQLPQRTLPQPAPVDLRDVQANLLRGYRAQHALHVGLRFPSADDGRKFIGSLLVDKALGVTPSAPWTHPPRCVMLGFTHAGLQALGLPLELLQRFPRAYREGPRLRAKDLGDEGASAPQHWRIGGFAQDGTPAEVHAVVSLLAKSETTLHEAHDALQRLMQQHRAAQAFEPLRADQLDEVGTVHFGYRDGLSQPRIAGVHDEADAAGREVLPPGDFLLAEDQLNSRGGRYIGELPPDLAGNASYVALRVIEQEVGRFEKLLDDVATKHCIDRELVAAKLMGRWRNGSPLVRWPQKAGPPAKTGDPGSNDFDFVSPREPADDLEGRRCPIGAHIRRLNPRGGLVVGVPWGRRVLRRGMPYGRPFRPGEPDRESRGLVGLFVCGDIEAQFEFLQRVWALKDLSAVGLRGTHDPFVGGSGAGTPFRFHPWENGGEVTVNVPSLTRTVGSLYLLMPGIAALHRLAEGHWQQEAARPLHAKAAPINPPASFQGGTAMNLDLRKFEASAPAFRADPYAIYAAFRDEAPVCRVPFSPPTKDAPEPPFWVFSHRLVKEACVRTADFLKPGKDRDKGTRPFAVTAQLGDGLFYMDPPRHTDVRKLMNELFDEGIRGAGERARELAAKLLTGPCQQGKIELVSQFASQLPMLVFMEIMGIEVKTKERDDPSTKKPVLDDALIVDQWVRSALDGHDPNGPTTKRVEGGTASMALRTYFLALARESRHKPAVAGARNTLVAGMAQRTSCPASASSLSSYEAMNTAVNFALGGYLSTEFLIASGTYNLLRHPEQWDALRSDRNLLPDAVKEMLRYDAPFQMADRWVANDKVELGGVHIPKGSKVVLVFGSANRDQHAFEDPDRFDIHRSPGENFGFGHGIHYCIGAQLALQVTEAAIDALLEHCPAARIADVGLWAPDPYFRQLKKLALTLH